MIKISGNEIPPDSALLDSLQALLWSTQFQRIYDDAKGYETHLFSLVGKMQPNSVQEALTLLKRTIQFFSNNESEMHSEPSTTTAEKTNALIVGK